MIIRGGTPHFEYVSSGVTQGLTQVALQDTASRSASACSPATRRQQALDRAGLPAAARTRAPRRSAAVLATAGDPAPDRRLPSRRLFWIHPAGSGCPDVKTFEGLFAELTERAQ